MGAVVSLMCTRLSLLPHARCRPPAMARCCLAAGPRCPLRAAVLSVCQLLWVSVHCWALMLVHEGQVKGHTAPVASLYCLPQCDRPAHTHSSPRMCVLTQATPCWHTHRWWVAWAMAMFVRARGVVVCVLWCMPGKTHCKVHWQGAAGLHAWLLSAFTACWAICQAHACRLSPTCLFLSL